VFIHRQGESERRHESSMAVDKHYSLD